MSRFFAAKRVTPFLLCGVVALASLGASAHEKNPIVANKVANKGLNPADPAAEAILAVVEQLRNAIKSGDTAMAERSMAENITIFEQGHAEKSRAEYVGHHFKEDVVFAKAVPSAVVSTEAKVAGSMAVVTAVTTTDGSFKDKPIKNAGVETYVLRLQDGRWQIEHIHWSSRKRP